MFDPGSFEVTSFSSNAFDGLTTATTTTPAIWTEAAPLVDTWTEQAPEG